MKHVVTVLAVDRGSPLGRLLVERLAWSSSRVAWHVRRGAVYVDGRRCRDATRELMVGQKITVHEHAAKESATSPPAAPAFVDDDVVVWDKPSGMPSIPTRRGGEVSLEELARKHGGEAVRLLHRLDRETSGLLLAVRSRRAGTVLTEQLRQHDLAREYFAIVTAQPAALAWVIRKPLLARGGLARVDASGKPAVTHVRLLRQCGGCALLALALETGRMHQIRAHLASEGMPLLGDTRYGGRAASRLALHAHRLRFVHPEGGEIDVHSPLPAQMRRLLCP